jgi:hypothetical protein
VPDAEEEAEKFSLCRAVNAIITRDWSKARYGEEVFRKPVSCPPAPGRWPLALMIIRASSFPVKIPFWPGSCIYGRMLI